MYLICYVTSHNHLIERAFIGGSSFSYVIFFYLSRDFSEHMFKGLCAFMGGSLSR